MREQSSRLVSGDECKLRRRQTHLLPGLAGNASDSGAECSASANSESSHESCDMQAHDGQLMASQQTEHQSMIGIMPTVRTGVESAAPSGCTVAPLDYGTSIEQSQR